MAALKAQQQRKRRGAKADNAKAQAEQCIDQPQTASLPTRVATTKKWRIRTGTEGCKGRMNLVLNNAKNVDKYYQSKGEKVEIEIVAYGPGLNMLREDTSPVKARIAAMALEMGNISFAACGNTKAKMAKKAGKEIKLIAEAKIVPSGVVRLMELQEQGWSYIRP